VLIELGFVRLLVSGGESVDTPQRAAALAMLAGQAGSRLQVLPGGGIRAHNAVLLAEAGASGWIHTSCRGPHPVSRFSAAQFQLLRLAGTEPG